MMTDALTSLLQSFPGLLHFTTADSTQQGLEEINIKRPTLIIVGDGLPELEVLEFLGQAYTKWPEIPCIVLTDGQEQRENILKQGGRWVIGSGQPAQKIFSVIEQALEGV